MRCLYIDTLIIGHTLYNVPSTPNEIALQNEWQQFITKTVLIKESKLI